MEPDKACVLVDVEESMDGIVKALKAVWRNQMEMAQTMQQLLTQLGTRMANLETKLDQLQARVVERDVRSVNRSIRTGEAFTFTAAKNKLP